VPDIDMHAPGQVQQTSSGGHTFVAFRSAVTNLGPGVLKVVGTRPAGSNQMLSKQILLSTNSVSTGLKAGQVADVGRFEYSPSVDHNHWHYLRFEDYMLLSVPNLDFVAPTRKTGFCLSGLNKPFYCAGGKPQATSLGWPEGDDTNPLLAYDYSNGVGLVARSGPDLGKTNPERRSADDDYGPSVEGQDIDITNVPAGRYCLSFVVNPDNKLREADYTNNGASKLIDVKDTPGGPRTLTLPTATPGNPVDFEGSGTCGLTKPVATPPTTGPGPGMTPPPTTDPGGPGTTPPAPGPTLPDPNTGKGLVIAPLTKPQAAKLTKTALKHKFKEPRSLTGSCTLSGPNKAICKVKFKQTGAPYRGSVTITQKLRTADVNWYYKIDVRRTRRTTCAARKRACPARVKTPTLLGGVVGANPVATKRALSAPPGPAAVARPGAAWSQTALPAGSRARLEAYEPVGD
jgi:hypothetical protein